MLRTDPTTKKIKKIRKMTVDCWIELINPTMDEIDKVVARTKVDEDLIRKMLDTEELPRVEQGENGTLIVIDAPYLEGEAEDKQYTTYPLGVIISNNGFVITVTPKRVKVLDDFKNDKVLEFRTAKKTKFLIQILYRTASYYLRVLKGINKEIEQKEKGLKKSMKNDDLMDLLEIEKTLVYFTTSLKANEVVLDKLSKGNIVDFYDEDRDLLDDAIIENKQAIEMSGIYNNILNTIKDTYETIASNNLNDAMKFLAGVTIVLSIPTMISSFLGMNIPLGDIMTNQNGFIMIVCLSVAVSLVIAYLLKKKNML